MGGNPIESRFGWLRQLSGANYYISTKQVLDSDRKIRALSLLKFSCISLSELDCAIQSSNSDTCGSCSFSDHVVADILNDKLSLTSSPSASDLNILFYISGYAARSACRITKCEHCLEALCAENDLPPADLDDSMPISARTFFDSVNRGGLKVPSEFVFRLTVHCWKVFEEIRGNMDMMSQFLSAENQYKLFYMVMDRATCHPSVQHCGLNNYMCTQGHNLTQLVVQRFFNCVAKNLAKQLSTTATQCPAQLSTGLRKIDKLCSRVRE